MRQLLLTLGLVAALLATAPPTASSTAPSTALLVPTDAAPAAGAEPRTASARPATGPRLTVPRSRLRRAVHCTERANRTNARQTVVLVHGTGSDPRETWSWNYVLALTADGFGVCTVRLPDHGLGSFTRSAEYVVHAVRHAHRLTGRRVSIVGHSQGGSMGLWVARFWPDVRRVLADVVSIAGPLRGTEFANSLCAAGRCVPLAWQLSRGSAHMRAQARGPLPKGPAFTSLVTRNDELVYPQPEVSSLPGVATFVMQDICPADPSEHGLILGDPLVYRMTVDALTHRGYARRSRLPADKCREAFIPHGDLQAGSAFLATPVRLLAGVTDPDRMTDAEPPLPAYARRSRRAG